MAELVVMLNRDADEKGFECQVKEMLASIGGRLHRMSDGLEGVGQYYFVENVPSDRLVTLRNVLAELPTVEAAYIKPTDELP